MKKAVLIALAFLVCFAIFMHAIGQGAALKDTSLTGKDGVGVQVVSSLVSLGSLGRSIIKPLLKTFSDPYSEIVYDGLVYNSRNSYLYKIKGDSDDTWHVLTFYEYVDTFKLLWATVGFKVERRVCVFCSSGEFAELLTNGIRYADGTECKWSFSTSLSSVDDYVVIDHASYLRLLADLEALGY